MRYLSILAVLTLIVPTTIIALEEGDEDGPSRALSFVDMGETAFDQTSAPQFISASDWNNDGYDDLLFNGYRLLRNTGPPDFNFIHMGSVFNGTVSGASNGVWADWDGDGDQDLYQGCRKGTNDRFWENQGAPDFKMEDISSEVFGSYRNPGPNTGNAWSDLDMDGDLDLYVGNGEDWNDGDPLYYPDFMLRNEEGNSFTDISTTSGIRTGENFYSRGATWGDHDNDRWQDLYVSHYRIRENHLFVNEKDGTFNEMGLQKNCSGTYDTTWYEDAEAGRVYGQSMWGPTWGHTIGSSWADFNRDGNLDLWTSDFVHKYVGYIGSWYDIRGYVCDDGNLYINDGAPSYTFTDHRNTSGIPIWPIGGSGTYQGDQTFSGVTIGDIDNDGWEDMYIPQVYGDLPYTTPHLFRNRGYVTDGSAPNGTTFEDITDTMGIDGANTYACLFFDRDNDGDLDIVTGGADTWTGSQWSNYRVRLYDNQVSNDNRYLRVQLNGTGLNRDAIGARVTVRFEGPQGDKQIMVREVRAGTGHAHQQSNVLHFGLGKDIDPEMMDLFRIEVRWPDGNIQWVRVRKADTTVYVDQPGSDSYPVIDSVSLSARSVNEDEAMTITVNAVQSDEPILYYLWDEDLDNTFDILTTTNSIPVTKFTRGTHQVRCYVVAGNGAEDNRYIAEAYPIEVQVRNLAPVVSIEPFSGYMDSTVVPDDYTMTDTPSDRRNLTWNISWGDGTSDTGTGTVLPGHTYKSPGEFDVDLTVSDEEYYMEAGTTAYIENVAPQGWIEVLPSGKKVFTEDVWVEFHPHVNDTPSDSTGHELVWIDEFGMRKNGDVNESVYFKFKDPGNKTIGLEITDRYGGKVRVERTINIENTPPEISLKQGKSDYISGFEDEEISFELFDVQDNETDMSRGFTFTWDFGDGTEPVSQRDPAVFHIYSNEGEYRAELTVTDKDEGEATYDVFVKIENVEPTISDLNLENSYMEDEEIVLQGLEFFDTISDLDSLDISVETSKISSISMEGEYPVIRFFHSGSYDLMVTVTDDNGAAATLTETVEIINQKPTATWSGLPKTLEEDQPFSIEVMDLYDTPSDLRNLTVEWEITGKDERVQGEKLELLYDTEGSKKITLLVSDGDSTFSMDGTIRVKNPIPHGEFELVNEKDLYFVGDEMIFNASASHDNPSDMDSLEYLWDMDDGMQLTGVEVNYSYTEPGEYHIVLTVTDDDGDYFMTSMDVEVLPIPVDKDENGPPKDYWTVLIIIIGVFIILLMAAILVTAIIKKRNEGHKGGGPPDMASTAARGRGVPPPGVRMSNDEVHVPMSGPPDTQVQRVDLTSERNL